PEMQVSYVYNVLRGMRGSPLVFYSIKPDAGKKNCMILDGLQRLTALVRFQNDMDMIFEMPGNKSITASEILSGDFSRLWSLVVPIRIYEFYSEIEAVNFYIEMNENITHSPEDIKRAKDYREVL